MTNLLRRLHNWAFGPNGRIIADDPDDPHLTELRAQGAKIPTIAGKIKP